MEALAQARERQEVARRFYEQKRDRRRTAPAATLAAPTTADAAAPEPIPDERIMDARYKMQDCTRLTMVVSQKRAQKMHTEQAASRTKGNTAYEAMEASTQARERQEEAKVAYEVKCQEAAEAEIMFKGAIKDTLEKAEGRNT